MRRNTKYSKAYERSCLVAPSTCQTCHRVVCKLLNSYNVSWQRAIAKSTLYAYENPNPLKSNTFFVPKKNLFIYSAATFHFFARALTLPASWFGTSRPRFVFFLSIELVIYANSCCLELLFVCLYFNIFVWCQFNRRHTTTCLAFCGPLKKFHAIFIYK